MSGVKKVILSLLLILNSGPIVYCQNVEDDIKDIRAKYQIVEESIKNNVYKSVYYDYQCPERNEYGTLISYSEENNTRKLEVRSILEEENEQNIQFYIWDDTVFFIFHNSVAPQMTEKGTTIYHHQERRYYLKNSKVIRSLVKEFTIQDSENASQKSKNEQNTQGTTDQLDSMVEIFQKANRMFHIDILGDEVIDLCLW